MTGQRPEPCDEGRLIMADLGPRDLGDHSCPKCDEWFQENLGEFSPAPLSNEELAVFIEMLGVGSPGTETLRRVVATIQRDRKQLAEFLWANEVGARCSYCGLNALREDMAEHMNSCEKHPIRIMRLNLEAAQREIARLSDESRAECNGLGCGRCAACVRAAREDERRWCALAIKGLQCQQHDDEAGPSACPCCQSRFMLMQELGSDDKFRRVFDRYEFAKALNERCGDDEERAVWDRLADDVRHGKFPPSSEP